MDPQDAIAKMIREIDGIVDAVLMDDVIVKSILDEEESVTSMTGVDVINQAYREVAEREVKICIFCNKTLSVHEEASLSLEDMEGNVLGMILKGEDLEKYSGRTDIIWISDDFILFPNIEPKGGERFILKAVPFKGLSEEDGVRNPILSSPAPSSDLMLKKYFGRNPNEWTSTVVLGYDHL